MKKRKEKKRVAWRMSRNIWGKLQVTWGAREGGQAPYKSSCRRFAIFDALENFTMAQSYVDLA
jgi:hypothetical protein